jgi:hypothetical protein
MSFCFLSVQATNYTWTGNSSSFWNNANNWSPVGIPSTGDRATINSGLCRIPHGYHAHVDAVTIGVNGEMIIRSSGRLYLHEEVAIPLMINGSLINKGRIYSNPPAPWRHIMSRFLPAEIFFKRLPANSIWIFQVLRVSVFRANLKTTG